MKFVVEMVSKQSGRLGILSKADVVLKTPLLIHFTKVNIPLVHSNL